MSSLCIRLSGVRIVRTTTVRESRPSYPTYLITGRAYDCWKLKSRSCHIRNGCRWQDVPPTAPQKVRQAKLGDVCLREARLRSQARCRARYRARRLPAGELVSHQQPGLRENIGIRHINSDRQAWRGEIQRSTADAGLRRRENPRSDISRSGLPYNSQNLFEISDNRDCSCAPRVRRGRERLRRCLFIVRRALITWRR
ncbi:hypothetical protein M433DRAFT_409977 [Acidomyces richmondensis BFW]|nr:MAG: hypothetical protein FE78DRAFT_291482 [Acidomyces sp. 'richmondensis']KYG42479.1 hypothetical protein M433DRAFT_409977 [Acidomyces richmondensis BFW]